ncbi:26S proteasome regulatory subunit rpn6 [Saitoella coloradoensis]
MVDATSQLQQAKEAHKKGDLHSAEQGYVAILSTEPGNTNDAVVREQEGALLGLGELYKDQKNIDALADLVRKSRTFMSSFAKAKSAKIIRTLIDDFNPIHSATPVQISITKECIEWALNDKRIFLRQTLEAKLIGLYLENAQFQDALKLIETLLRELKKLDDKAMLVEVHLLESRVLSALRNLAKSRAALTAARTNANSIYCPPLLQAGLDMQSGILHADDRDFKTAYSYFFEALEGYAGINSPSASNKEAAVDTYGDAVRALKYMLLCKIMMSETDDLGVVVGSKMAQKYVGREVEAMKAVAVAHQKKSLAEFEKALSNYKSELQTDPIIRQHFTALYDSLLESNLLRILQPFSRVEISYIAETIQLSQQQVENKLSQMILDKVLKGVLDQGSGCVEIFEEQEKEVLYNQAVETMKHLGDVVDLLYEKARKLR